MLTPVDTSIKEKVIAAHLAGSGRNRIQRDLLREEIKVSQGSVSKIINAYKLKIKHQTKSAADMQPKEEKQHSNNSKYTDVSIIPTTGPQSFDKNNGDWQAVTNTTTATINNSRPNVGSTPTLGVRNGGPLSHLLNEDMMIDSDSIITNTDQDVISSPSPSEDVVGSPGPVPASPVPPGAESPSSPPAPPGVSGPFVTVAGISGTGPIENNFEQERFEWDYYGPASMRILKQIRKEKDERQS